MQADEWCTTSTMLQSQSLSAARHASSHLTGYGSQASVALCNIDCHCHHLTALPPDLGVQVFGDKTTQSKLYDEAIQPVVSEVLAGFNCTIFAYGQTGTGTQCPVGSCHMQSAAAVPPTWCLRVPPALCYPLAIHHVTVRPGKTYTMEGGMRDSSDGSKLSDVAGVIPRAINQIFEHVGRIGGDLNTVKCSFLELYNEEATDLLASSEWLHMSEVRPRRNSPHMLLRRKPAGEWHTCNSILTQHGTLCAEEGVKLTIQQDLSQGGDSVQVSTVWC